MDHFDATSRSWHAWLEARARRYLLFARAQARCEADAQDLLQEALVEVWRRGRGEPGDDALVFKTIRRRAIDLGRRTDRRTRRETAAAPVQWWAETDDDPGLDRRLDEAMKSLPASLREVVTLKIWGELTLRQVSEVLVLPPGTVATRYRSAIEQLRGMLKEVRS